VPKAPGEKRRAGGTKREPRKIRVVHSILKHKRNTRKKKVFVSVNYIAMRLRLTRAISVVRDQRWGNTRPTSLGTTIGIRLPRAARFGK